MQHPDLLDNPPIEVADSAAPQHRAGGWFELDTPPKPQAAASVSEAPPTASVRMSHQDIDDEITVAASAAPFHIAAGWSVIKDTPKEQADGSTPGSNKTRSARPRASAAKKEEG